MHLASLPDDREPGTKSVRSRILTSCQADIRGLGLILGGLRNDVTYPADPGAFIHKRQRPACPIERTNVLDEDWVPVVAARGWLIITRHSRIIEHPNEIAAVRGNGGKMVALNQQAAKTKWVQLEVFMTRWRDIEPLASKPGPFIWRASRTAMTPIPLES